MECPNCGLLNPPISERCDCGFDFNSRTIKESLVRSEELNMISVDPHRVPYFFGLGPFGHLIRLMFQLIKWFFDLVSGDARRRRRLRSAYERAERLPPGGY